MKFFKSIILLIVSFVWFVFGDEISTYRHHTGGYRDDIPTFTKPITRGRIIGGSSTTTAQFPFMAAILVNFKNQTIFCGGTLINKKWIVTAAHCIYGSTSISVELGATCLDSNSPTCKSSNEPKRVNFKTASYVIHPEFNYTSFENDIGLINLNTNISTSLFVKPIDALSKTDTPENERVVIAGWGRTDDINGNSSALSDRLIWANLFSITNDECRLIYGNQIANSMICAVGKNMEGTCNGDIGGPLIRYSTPIRLLAGIATFLSGNGCKSGDPSGFTRIEPYVAWIDKISNA